MDIKIDRAVLLRTLSRVQGAVERRTTTPILSNVLLNAENGALAVTATDGNLTVSEEVACTVEDDGATTAPASTFHDLVRKLPEGSEVRLDDGGGGERLSVRSRRAHYNLATLPRNDFPLPTEDEADAAVDVPAPELRRLIDDVRFAVSTDETSHPPIQGVCVHPHGSGGDAVLRGAATNGHRLARFETPAPEGAEGLPTLVIPRKAINELRKLTDGHEGDVHVEATPRQARFAFGVTRVVTKLIEGEYPDYDAAVPTDAANTLHVHARSLREAADRASTLSTNRVKGVRLELSDGTLSVSATGNGTGEGRENLDADYEGGELTIGFNARYLVEILERIGDGEARIELNDESRPVVIRDAAGTGSTYVLMPMIV